MSEAEGNVPDMNALSSRVQYLTKATDFWNGWMLWSLVAVTIVAGMVALTTRLAIVRTGQLSQAQDDLNKAKEAQLALDLKSKDVKIGELGTQAAGANARIAEAQRRSAEANALAKEAQASLALAEQHSAEANTKAEGFRLDIARANERAASANETAERERLARIQLEARLADRVITPDQKRRITELFASIKGQTVDVVVVGDSLEITKTFTAILEGIHNAGGIAQFVPSNGRGICPRRNRWYTAGCTRQY
jgi:hypothetical protein